MTSTSTPLSPRISSAPRALLHTGLWYTTIASSSVMVREATPPSPSGNVVARRRPTARGDRAPGTGRAGRRPRRATRGAASSTARRATSATVAHQLDECDDRDLRRVGDAVELRLGREQPADARCRTAHRPRVSCRRLPRLDAVRPPELGAARVYAATNFFVDPTVRSPRIGAAADHVDERGVDPDLEAPLRAPQRSTHVQPVERDDRRGDRATTSPAGRGRSALGTAIAWGTSPGGRRRARSRARGRRRHRRSRRPRASAPATGSSQRLCGGSTGTSCTLPNRPDQPLRGIDGPLPVRPWRSR